MILQRSLWVFLLVAIASILVAQTPYYGPKPLPHFNEPKYPAKLYHVQLYAYDDPAPGGLKIQDVTLAGQAADIKPPDIHGFRGGGGFRLAAGKYKLSWNVSRDDFSWPRSLHYEQTITVVPRDTWLQVTIRGDKVTTL